MSWRWQSERSKDSRFGNVSWRLRSEQFKDSLLGNVNWNLQSERIKDSLLLGNYYCPLAYTQSRTHARTHFLFPACERAQAHTYSNTRAYLHVHTLIHTYIHTHACTHTHRYARTHTCVCTQAHTHRFVCVHIRHLQRKRRSKVNRQKYPNKQKTDYSHITSV